MPFNIFEYRLLVFVRFVADGVEKNRVAVASCFTLEWKGNKVSKTVPANRILIREKPIKTCLFVKCG